MMLIFKVFVTLPLQFNDNNCEKKKKKKKKKHLGNRTTCRCVSPSLFSHPFMSVFVMYHSQTRSPETDRERPAESESKVRPKPEVSTARGG